MVCKSAEGVRTIVAAVGWALASTACSSGTPGASPRAVQPAFPTVPAPPVAMAGLHVVGNKLENKDGQPLFLHGVNRSGDEGDCVYGNNSTFLLSGQDFVEVLKKWNVNVVRVPLNEDCWLGINSTPTNAAVMGAPYQAAIEALVDRLTSNNLAVILDLHWSAPGTALATGQQPMPDADHSVEMWKGVASAFRTNTAVIFDLFNEPYPNFDWGPQSPAAAWICWQKGGSSCSDPKMDYAAVGMQTLVDTVRSAGAPNVVMVAGLQYANEMGQWLDYRPADPLHNVAASWHSYYPGNYCNEVHCWTLTVQPVAAQVPVITGEFGDEPNKDGTCNTRFLNSLWNFLETNKAGYVSFVFRAWGGGCTGGGLFSLIADENGTPTDYGEVYRRHIQALPSTYTP